MLRQRYWMLGLIGILAIAPAATGADPPDEDRDVLTTASRIDKHLLVGWRVAGVEPAAPADDAEFLRRVYLDLAGRIPSVAEAQAFLNDNAPDKRQELVKTLLKRPRYVTHFTNVWRSLLLPEASTNLQARFLAPGFETWLREQLEKNAGYDQMVREILTTPIERNSVDRVYGGGNQSNPLAYYLAKDASPENLAAGTARIFLGFRLECAQCHDHPFAKWKRDQFWSYAAFFAGIQRQRNGDFSFPSGEAADKRELTIPGTERVVQATFPDGKEPNWKFKVSTRTTLADWMTAPENPFFARAVVNRMWFYFFGRGLVDPVDEMVGGESVTSHPELLDELAKEFAAHKFDLKFLIRAITATKAYQLTSARPMAKPDTPVPSDEPRLFARMPLRGMSPEQLFDSISQATGYQEGAPRDPRFGFGGPGTPREEFLTKFANQSDRPTEYTTSILQALALMNGRLVADATSLERSVTLAGILSSPFMDTTQRIETLYLATVSRKPKPKELERFVKFVESSEGEDKEKAQKQALADVFWILLNTSEFFLNH